MPTETKQAVQWAFTQTITNQYGETVTVTKDTVMPLVDKVREYFNTHGIAYSTFSYADLQSYL